MTLIKIFSGTPLMAETAVNKWIESKKPHIINVYQSGHGMVNGIEYITLTFLYIPYEEEDIT